MPVRPRVEIDIRLATASDVTAAIDVLSEASAWLRSIGIAQWPERFADSFVAATAERGELYVAVEGPEVVGTMTMLWSDAMFWGDRRDAGFVHRLAVMRSHAGVGRRLIDWADEQAEQHRRSYLCLDTLSSNRKLREYYEELGFELVGEVDGPREHPHTAAHGRWQASLYERLVGQHRQAGLKRET
ncbi:MAG: GNAT family N-acetyltransferase [Acidimicrobiales bacterium]